MLVGQDRRCAGIDNTPKNSLAKRTLATFFQSLSESCAPQPRRRDGDGRPAPARGERARWVAASPCLPTLPTAGVMRAGPIARLPLALESHWLVRQARFRRQRDGGAGSLASVSGHRSFQAAGQRMQASQKSLWRGGKSPYHGRDKPRLRQPANSKQGKNQSSPDVQHHRQKDTEGIPRQVWPVRLPSALDCSTRRWWVLAVTVGGEEKRGDVLNKRSHAPTLWPGGTRFSRRGCGPPLIRVRRRPDSTRSQSAPRHSGWAAPSA